MKENVERLIWIVIAMVIGLLIGAVSQIEYKDAEVDFLTNYTQHQQERINGFEVQLNTCEWKLEKLDDVYPNLVQPSGPR